MKIVGTGIVSGVYDPNTFVIKFTVKNYIEDAIAYPADLAPDEPNVGDPVLIYETETIFGYSFLYTKLRLKDHIRMKLGNSSIEVHDYQVYIHTENGNEVNVTSDGDINIPSNTGAINIRGKSEVNINCSADVKVKGNNITLDGPIKSTATNPASTDPGPFCAIKTCPVTGLPHTSNSFK